MDFMTWTQGAFGNDRGNIDGMPTFDKLEMLLSMPLTIGKDGRSLTFTDAQCVIDRLPTGGDPMALPEDLGDATACDDDDAIDTMNRNTPRYRNNLIGQTVTLALNIRLNPGMDMAALCDGLYLDPVIFDALFDAGLPATAGGLLTLANCALAGEDTYGASYYDIAYAAELVNENFKVCGSGYMEPTIEDRFTKNQVVPTVLLQNAPNPFNLQTSISIDLPQAEQVDILVFDTQGRLVRTLHSGYMGQGIHQFTFDGVADNGSQLRSGMYFYTLRTPTYNQTRRMLYLP
jgi:hypothetical protein